MKSFNEWFKDTMPNTHKGVGSEKIETFVYEAAQDAWNFKQAEVDELQERIDEAFKSSKEFYDFGDGESAMAFYNEIMNILKGNKNEH